MKTKYASTHSKKNDVMKNGLTHLISKIKLNRLIAFAAILLSVSLLPNRLNATTKTSIATGNWSNGTIWSPAGVPAAGDDVVIHSGNTVTVDSIYSCNNLNVGDATAANATLTVTAANSLTINGDVRLNAGNKGNTFILDAGAGTLNIAGTFSTWATAGTNSLRVAAGTLNVMPALTISSTAQNITFTGAGTINFSNSFTDNYNKLVTFTGCTVNFAKSYTVNTTAASWAGKGTAIFSGTGYGITPNSNLTLFNVQFNAPTTLNTGAGTTIIGGDFTISSGATFTAGKDFDINGNWVNDGTFIPGGFTVAFNGTSKTIGGASSTDFSTLQMGSATSSVTQSCTVNTNISCSSLNFNANTRARTLTLSTGDTLTVSGDVTIQQPTASVTSNLNIASGVCNISGGLTFTGTNNTTARVGKVTVTSGELTIGGAVTWMSNTAVATEVITVSTGTITFGTSVAMGSGSGSLTVTNSGTINFNGNSIPSFDFGGATAPVFTTASNSSLYFKKGFTNNTNALTFNSNSYTYFTGSGTIALNAAVTFGHVQVNAGAVDTLTAGGAVVIKNFTLSPGALLKLNNDIQVDGNWTNNGGNLSGLTATVILNGNGRTISGAGSTSFPNLQIGNGASTVSYTMNNNNSCVDLTFSSSTVARTLTIAVGDTLAASGNLTLNQPTAAVTNQLAVNAGVCTVAGNLVFSGTNNTTGYLTKIGVTTGAFSVNGTVSWMSNTAVTTEVITVSKGSLAFGSQITMGSGSGMLSASSNGTIRFNGATTPSLNFGGAATSPTFTTVSGTTVYFNKGLTNNSNALTFNANTTCYFTGNGSITPNADITFGHLEISTGARDTLAAAAGAVTVAGDITLASGATFVTNKDLTITGNWTNNGGTFNGGTSTLIINGLTKTIGGTSRTAFNNLQIGSTAVTVNYSTAANITCNNLVFSASTANHTLTLGNGNSLTVNGNLSIEQPTADTRYNSLRVNAGTCVVSGNLLFSGTSATATRVSRVLVTSGSFTLNGTISWMANTAPTTEIITATTGTLNFGSSVIMGSASGTISVTSTGAINFNGTTAPSLYFGGTIAPVLSTAFGSSISFVKGITTDTTALTLATGNTAVFTGTGTITPISALSLSNVQINSGTTATAGGDLIVKGSWDDQGTFAPGTYNVTFSGSVTRTISRTGGETFYDLTAPGGSIQTLNNVLVAHNLTLSGALIDLNGNTLTLGNNAGAALTYSSGRVFGGTFKRWFPATAITSTSGSYYGLFPIGTNLQYRPITINSTVNPTTAGYVLATHSDVGGATAVTYTDNQGVAIEQIANMHSDITTSGLAGGTYNLDVKYTNLGSNGSTANLRLITYTGSTLGSYGTHAATTSSVASPLGHRTALTTTQLNNAWVISSTNKATTPLLNYIYSRTVAGNWNDSTATGSWSYTPGGAGAPCSCLPTSSDYATIEAGQTITATSTEAAKFLDIKSSGALTINSGMTVNVKGTMTMFGTATFTNNGTLKVDDELVLSSPTSPTVNGNVQVVGQLTLPAGTAYTQSSGTLTLNGALSLSGALHMASGSNFVFSGNGAHISGTGTYTTDAGGSFPATSNKVIESGTAITIGTPAVNTFFSISSNGTIFNQGSITINGDLVGGNSHSTWENYPNSSLSITGTLLSTGAIDAATSPNTVAYAGNGAQTIKVPVSSYNILTATNAGTKTLAGNIVVDNQLTLAGSVVLDEGTGIISGSGNLNMSGTPELKLQRSISSSYPELSGTYTCTGGTVTINQTAGSSTIAPANYYNLKLNGTTAYDLGAVSQIANNLDIQNSAYLSDNNVLTVGGTFTYASSATTALHDSIAVGGLVLTSGTLQDGNYSINVFGNGGWSKASAATFTPGMGTVYFTGTGAQTLGGTSASQTFNNLYIGKSSNTLTVGGSTTALTINGNLTLGAGTFDKGTAATITITTGDWINNGGTFTPGTGTVLFNAGNDQSIRGTKTAETFNNLTVTKDTLKLTVEGNIATLNIGGNLTLNSGTLDAGTANNINMTAGNWTNNGATFTPANSTVTFSGSGAQAINGTSTVQTFKNLTTNKSGGTLSVSGSTTSLTLNGTKTITSGTFNAGTAADIYVAGNWTMTGGTFTNTGSTVTMNGSTVQNMSSTGAFNKLNTTNSNSYVNLTSDITVNSQLILTTGIIQTNAYSLILGSSATTTGAGSTSYIYGNEKINIPNAAAPSRTFTIGDATKYAPVLVTFAGTTSGSGSLTASTTGGDDADINHSGIFATKSANRTWTLSNSGVGGFTSYASTFTFDSTDVDAGATASLFVGRRYTGATWYNTNPGTRTSTSTQITGETTFGKIQLGELDSLRITAQPGDTSICTGSAGVFISTATTNPVPTVKWQRDPNTGVFADITAGMDGSVYSGYTSTTLIIADVAALNNYKYRAIFDNTNSTVTSDSAVLTVKTTPSVTSTTPGSVCNSGTVSLVAAASAGSVNWYADTTSASVYTGTSYTTPSISATTTFYTAAVNNGCTSARTAVDATVVAGPTIVSTTPGAVCDAGTVNLAATASAGTVNWYIDSTGGSSLYTGTSYTTPSISSTTTYYADATYNDCSSPSRTPVVATADVTPAATIAYQSCAGVDGMTTIQIGATNGTAPFTYKLNSGSFTSTDTVHIANGSNQNYYVQDSYGCTSAATNYTATSVVPTTIATATGNTTCNCPSAAEGREVYLTNTSGELIAIINDRGHNLGNVTATTYIRANPVLIDNAQGGKDAAMGRSFVLDFIGTNLTPSVEVKFPFTSQELSDLIVAAAATPIQSDDINTLTDLGSTQYEGPGEDDSYSTADASMLVRHRQLGTGTILNGQFVKIALSANGEHWLHGNSNGSPLPVKLVAFGATANQTTAQIETDWTTSLEIDNDYFVVERSEDAINFNEVGRVSGAGNSTATLNYRFNDTKPFQGLSYYRLKQVDFDGASAYSDIVAVTLGSYGSFTVYPNPTENDFSINLSNGSAKVEVSIFDLNGRQVFAQSYNDGTPSKNQVITVRAKDILTAGMYMVHVSANGAIMQQKLIVN